MFARGPIRAAQTDPGGDFQLLYGGTLAWAAGQNPYHDDHIAQALQQQGLLKTIPPGYDQINTPPLFVVLAPLTLLPWSAARAAWIALNTLACFAAVGCLPSFAGLSWKDTRTIWLLACALALAPFHSALAVGQVTPLSIAAACFAILLARKRYDLTAGTLLGLSICIKPTLGGIFALYFLLHKQWRALSLAAACTAVIGLIALVQLHLHDTPWYTAWRQNVHAFTHGGHGDPSPQNPSAASLLNLHPVVQAVIQNQTVAALIVWATIGTMLALASYTIFRRQNNRHEHLELGTLTTLSLLIVYHRFYDAALLIFPLAWAFHTINTPHRRKAWAVIIATLPALIPGGVMLSLLADQGHLPRQLLPPGALFDWIAQHLTIPPSLTNTWLWQGLLVPHLAWLILLIAAILLTHLWATGKNDPQKTER